MPPSQDVFHEREKLYQTWQHAQQTLTKKREARARLELQGRSDKLQQMGDEVTEVSSGSRRGHSGVTMSGDSLGGSWGVDGAVGNLGHESFLC